MSLQSYPVGYSQGLKSLLGFSDVKAIFAESVSGTEHELISAMQPARSNVFLISGTGSQVLSNARALDLVSSGANGSLSVEEAAVALGLQTYIGELADVAAGADCIGFILTGCKCSEVASASLSYPSLASSAVIAFDDTKAVADVATGVITVSPGFASMTSAGSNAASVLINVGNVSVIRSLDLNGDDRFVDEAAAAVTVATKSLCFIPKYGIVFGNFSVADAAGVFGDAGSSGALSAVLNVSIK